MNKNLLRRLSLAAACSLALVGIANLNSAGQVVVRDGGMPSFDEIKMTNPILDEIKMTNPILDEIKMTNPILSADKIAEPILSADFTF